VCGAMVKLYGSVAFIWKDKQLAQCKSTGILWYMGRHKYIAYMMIVVVSNPVSSHPLY
jgi:hypothetical protein